MTEPISPHTTALLDKKRKLLATLLESALAGFDETDIAIVGLSGRYPGADTLDEFWENLRAGRESIGELPESRFDWRRWYDPEPGREGRLYTARGGFLADADKFDPLFFNISPREAESMDPQERIFLEVAWAAMEDAGHPPSSLQQQGARVGVFVGAMNNGYGSLGATAWARGVPTGARSAFWSIANRLSYICDFRGPSLCVDTACSASLTAIHLACESIRRGECDAAIAGGVNIIIHPLQLIGLCSLTMLSPTGRCHAFGAGADGFVDGEGAGAVLLKPLARAVADRDHVWGVIRGSFLNAGGKTSGYTVPNPHEQATCVREALGRARVDPRSISYVEAHGTGTALGDPIEVAGLNRVFGAAEAPTRALGSVKANVGHLESAAGICGLTRILLQMRHGTLAPSLHCDPPNPKIPFAGSSFRVVREAEPWRRPILDGKEAPRRAGLSSFGAGGANAHMMIEELRDPLAALAPPCAPPFLLVLSARDGERLDALARAFSRFLRDERRGAPVDPGRLCYTLQVGREAMAARLAVVGANLASLAQGLASFLAGEPHPGVYRGHVKHDRQRLAALEATPRPALIPGMDADGLERWAELWVCGGEVPWGDLYSQGRPQRMSLPTYPFARESYWVDSRALQPEPATSGVVMPAPDAPLTIQVRIGSDDWRLRDHHVQGRPLLPGAALAEIVLSSVRVNGRAASRLREVHFMAPLALESEHLDLTLRIQERAEERLVEVLHGERPQGRALVGELDAAQEPPPVDLDALRARCDEVSTGEDPYERFAREGITYGPSFRLMRGLWMGRGECVVRLEPSREAPGPQLSWTALLDAAFQAVSALGEPFLRRHGLHLPHTIEELRVIGAPTVPAFVHVRQPSPEEPRFDVVLLDARGHIIAEVTDFRLRPVGHGGAARPPVTDSLLFGITSVARPTRPGPDPRGAALLFDREDVLRQQLARRHPTITWFRVSPAAELRRVDAHHIALDPAQPEHLRALVEALAVERALPELILDGLADGWSDTEPAPGIPLHARFMFHLLRILRPQDRPTRLLSWSRRGAPEHLALSAMFRSVQHEWPSFAGRVLALEAGHADAPEALAALLADEWRDRDPNAQVFYRQGQRHVPALEPVAGAGSALSSSGGGTWLITGGAGGLGFLLARHLARHAGARLVLSGRTAPGPSIEQRLQTLRDAGAQALYHACDVTVEDEVRALMEACGRLGPLRGVVHAAGLTRDARLGDKQESAFAEVLAVKRLGALHLDRATAGMPLDFFVLCSSMAGLMGNAGQVDYAYANAWLDHFAEQREAQRLLGMRSGCTRAVGWPPLAEGGMALDPGSLEWLRSRFGLIALDARGCVATFEAALRSDRPRLLAVSGDAKRLRQSLLEPAAQQPERERAPAERGSVSDRARIIEAARALLRALLSETLRVPEGRIDPDEALDAYGVDSVSAMALARALEARVGAVPRTLFLEYPTLAALTDYLVEHHTEALVPPEVTAAPRASSPPSSLVAAPVLAQEPRHASQASARPLGDHDLIAIIGMAGRFPGAPDLASYWESLRLGRSSIVEVPASRWDPCDDGGAGGGRWGGFLEDVDRFDHALFQIAQVEAASMDPADRLFLEIAWETLEHAGYPRSRRADAQRRTGLGTGVFVGCMYRQYAHLARDPRTRGLLSNGSYWSIANRASWFFDLQGPSVAIDNACAAGLTSVHQACRALADGECEMALAGAVNLSLHPHKYTGLRLMGLSTSSPAPRLFGHGDGFVPGEGVAAVLLKPLSRAQADGDRILAIIRASRVNHGGKTVGFSVPGVRAQAELVARTLERAGVQAGAIDYLELAANGSEIGDAVELRALSRVFGAAPPGSIPVGSTKAALGHLEAASGLAQLIKVVLQLRHRELCPSVPVTQAETTRLPDDVPFRLVPAPIAWERAFTGANDAPRPARAGIHSFGAGGSNAFLLLESYDPPDHPPPAAAGSHLFLFSAATHERLLAWVSRVRDHLERHTPAAADLAYTLQIGRERLPSRLAVVADGIPALRELLTLWLEGGTDHQIASGEAGADDPWLDGPEGEAFLRIVLEHRRLDKLARLWVRGVDADWTKLHPHDRPQLVELPPYPFARTVCWLDTAPLARESTSSIQGTLRSLLGDLLKLDPERLDARRDLRDYGVDSMLGTFFLLGIRERLQIDLPLSALRDTTNLEALTQQLEAALARAPDAAGEEPRLPAELIRIQRGGREMPSFWVHGAPGFAQVFTQLPAVLGPDRPVYAFQARGLDGTRPPFMSLSEMVDHYVDALQRARPEGPYLLGGYSLGGLIALEMAQLLSGRGSSVAAVVMFDTYPVGPNSTEDAHLPDSTWKLMVANMFLLDGSLPADALDGVPEAIHETHLVQLLTQRGRTILPTDELYPYLRGSFAVSTHHREALRQWQPKRLDGVDVLYVRATRTLDGLPASGTELEQRAAFWQGLLERPLRILDLDAGHFELLAAPHHPLLRAELASLERRSDHAI